MPPHASVQISSFIARFRNVNVFLDGRWATGTRRHWHGITGNHASNAVNRYTVGCYLPSCSMFSSAALFSLPTYFTVASSTPASLHILHVKTSVHSYSYRINTTFKKKVSVVLSTQGSAQSVRSLVYDAGETPALHTSN